jgi:monoamine oxidase
VSLYKDRDEFIERAQHPEKGILVIGEVVSKHQGWTEGALDSVKEVLTKKWVNTIC